jgi:hypothetical protein
LVSAFELAHLTTTYIGYDYNNVEFYLFFGQKFNGLKDLDAGTSIASHIETMLSFVGKRKRNWSLIFFHDRERSNNDA